jgi:hypothetical protein
VRSLSGEKNEVKQIHEKNQKVQQYIYEILFQLQLRTIEINSSFRGRGLHMIRCRFRAFACVFLIPLTLPALHADVTLRYKTEIKMNPTLPAQMTAAMGGADAIIPQDRVLQLKAGRGFSTAPGYNSITDFTTQEITLLDATTSRYAKLKASQLAGVLTSAAPKMPAEALAAMASLKTDVSPAKVTGRTALIQGVETEEREIVISISGPAVPNMPPARRSGW